VATHSISLLVNNRPGVLARVSDLIGRIGCNIEKLSVGACKEPAIARMKFEISMEANGLDQVLSRLTTLLDVIQVKAVTRPRAHRSYPLASRWRDQISQSRAAGYWLVAYGLFITLFGTNVPAPLYALYRVQWNLPPVILTLVFAAYAIVVIPSIIVSGQLSDQIGRFRVLIPGVLFTLMGSICFLLADGPGMLVASRILQGISVGVLNGVAVAAMTELGGSRTRTQAALAAAVAVTAGNALGPVVSGILGQLAPYPTQLPYVIHALLVLPGILGLLLMREPLKPTLDKARIRWPHVPRAMRSSLYLSSLTSFIVWSVMSLILSVIPAYLPVIIGNTNLIVSGAVIAVVLGVSAWSQFQGSKLPLFPSLTIGYLLLGAGLLGLMGAIAAKSLALLALSAILIGLGHGPCYSRSLTYLNEASPDASRAEIVSLYYAGTYLGVGIPILGLGFGAQWIGLIPAIEAFTALIGILILVSLYLWRRHL
jgi:MFS family permease/acetolactate synthase regulatory subunit